MRTLTSSCRPLPWPLTASVLLLAACSGATIESERDARADLDAVSGRYRPAETRPALPELTPAAPLAEYLRFALLNSPRVEAAYYDWAAAVEGITLARSLPDPRLSFSLDIADTVMGLMPGLMVDLPGPGKLRAAGDLMAAESRGRYIAFEREVLRTALTVKTAYHRLHFLDETLRVRRELLRLAADLERLLQQQSAAGLAPLQDLLRARIAREQGEAEIVNLTDARGALAVEWKSALGIRADEADPPVPADYETSAGDLDAEALLEAAMTRNPELRAMEADVRRAEAALVLARKTGESDFTLGLEADVRVDSMRADPTMLTPSAGMTLPIWRDKVAAEIAAAQADKRAAEARLSAEQVQLAADLASLLYLVREAARNDALLWERLVPKASAALDAARTGYINGRAGFLDLIETQRVLLEFELAGIEAGTQRELALASLSLAIAGSAPAGAPLLAVTEESP